MASSARVVVALLLLLGSGEARAAQLTASWVDNSGGTAATRIERRLGTDTMYAGLADVVPGATATSTHRSAREQRTAIEPSHGTPLACRPTPTRPAPPQAMTGTRTSPSAKPAVGTVVSSPTGIDCGTACSATYLAGTLVTLAATPAPGSTFDGWSGTCVGTAPCSFAGNTPVSVTASFSAVPVPAPVPAPAPVSYALTVAKSGPGTVTSTPSGINCGSDCSEAYGSGTTVTLTAAPNKNGSTFTGWSGGGCSGSSATCLISLQAATSVSATFKNGRGE